MKKVGTRCPVTGFAPDATFVLDVRDDAAATAFMRSEGLIEDKFLCAVPRLRATPYWEIHREQAYPANEVATKTALNAKYAEADHAKLREVIVRWVRETGLKVLICPEMTYAVDIIRPLVYDPLPADVKPMVVAMNRFWLTDEAASVYRRARVVVSFECHSPIMAIAAGKPGIYGRQPTDTWKGQMYPDLGLGDWKLEIETTTGAQLADRVLALSSGDYAATTKTANAAVEKAQEKYAEAFRIIRGLIPRA